MPNIKSAKKRMRQNIKAREQNRSKKAEIRTYEKKLRKAVEQNNEPAAVEAYKKFSSSIDKATKTNLVHKNNANRKKSRLSVLVKKVQGKAEPAPQS